MDFTSFQGGPPLFQRDDVPGHIGGKGVSGLMGHNLHIAGGAVKVGKDKGYLIVWEGGAVTASGFSLFAQHIQEMPLKHDVDKSAGFRG